MSLRPHTVAFLLAIAIALVSNRPAWSASGAGPTPTPILEDPAAPLASNPASQAAVAFGDHWSELGPPGRAGQAGIYDERRGRLVVFGGRIGRQLRGDVWVLPTGPPSAWERVEPLGTPPSPRSGAAAVYDRPRDRMLLFFGEDSAGAVGDVWELSLNGRPSWRRLAPAGPQPGARFGHTATLDPENDRVIVYGGGNNPPYWQLDPDVWQLTLAPRLEWSRVPAAGVGPPARAYHSAVYAPDLHGILVFGGLWMTWDNRIWSYDYHDSTDVWLLSTRGAARWTDLTPRITGAPTCGLHGHVATYDVTNSRMLVLPGRAWKSWRCSRDYWSATWSLSLKDLTWTFTPGIGSSVRTFATAAADGAGGMLVFGGGPGAFFSWEGSYSDTWRLKLDAEPTWSRVLPAISPPAPSRWEGQSAIYDPVRDRALLWTGGVLWSRSASGRGGWEVLATEGDSPPQAAGHAVVYDSERDRLIVYGGDAAGRRCEERVWTLTLSTPMTWSLLEPAGDAPGRSRCAAIYDPVRDRLVVYGGGSTIDWQGQPYPWHEGDVWALNLSGTPAWERIVGSRDVYWGSYTMDASAIYDPVRDRMVVFGGGVSDADSWLVSNDVWALTLDGAPQWQQLVPASWRPTDAPEPRALHAALYDEIGDRMIIVGGYCPGPFQRGPWHDVWALDLSSARWTQLAPSGGPAPEWARPLVVRDTRRHSTMVMEDGVTWTLDQGPGRSGGRAAGPSSSHAAGESTALALRALRSNPGAGPISVAFSLPDAAPARLELFDVAGRRLWSRDVGSFGPGEHAMTVGDGTRVPAGLYWLRLARGGDVRTLKVVRVE